jgi:two-component system sensor histidine kinase CpxA
VLAVVLSLAAFMIVSRIVIGGPLMQTFEGFNTLHFVQARAAYEGGGSAALSRYLAELNQYDLGEHHLTDARGKDLATGDDLGEMARSVAGSQHRALRSGDKILFGNTSADGHYVWVAVVKPPFSMWLFAPFYLLLLATVGALYWLVTTKIAKPLRRLAAVVDRFGRADLSARAAADSKDEVGNLGRSFNDMADRIQTLLTAERQLLQDVSHELRSPLARLTFEAEMVRKTNDRDATAARLRHEIERLSELVRTLIDMTRLEGDPGTVETEDVCLADLLRGIADDCSVEAAARGCGIAVTPSDVVHVRGNGELLHRAFENVVRNAVRYSPAGTAVEIGLQMNGGSAIVTVRDHGPGIPASLLSRIFDPFFRVDPSRDEHTGGLGLGLAIARRAIRVHQGEITVENMTPGALFRISLPLGI